jgi:DNA primase
MEDGRQARFLFLPEGEDPDTMVRAGGQEQFERLLQSATPLETFLFDRVSEGIDTSSLDGRARLSKLALPYIRQLPEGVYKQLMFQALAQRTGLELESLMRLEVPPPSPDPATPDREWPAENTGNQPPPIDAEPPPDFSSHPGFDQDGASQPRQRPMSEQHEGGYSNLAQGATSQPRQRPMSEQHEGGYSNLAQGAIALILHKPEIGRKADPAILADIQGGDVELLRQLLELVHRRPESNTGMLLGHWYGTPEGELLNRLAGQERLIPAEGIEEQFRDTMESLAHHLPHQSKLAAQVDKLKLTNYAEVSELEKQRLRELLQEKRQRDAQRKKR